MSKIFVIVGPTAVGKTTLSISLAKKYNAEVINADATQVYKEANIGTAKITEEEKEGIIHHMIDIVSLNQAYTVKDYQTDARRVLDKLICENKNVIIVGGSGLYLKALLYDYQFTEESHTKDYSIFNNEELKSRVDSIYKDNSIHVNNRKRLERFLSHYETTGNIIKNFDNKDVPLYDFTIIGLYAPKEKIEYQIKKRVDKMINNGLLEEVKTLNHYKKTKDLIGYKEILMYLNNEITLEEAKDLITKNTKKFAKRQMTWYRHQFNNINWFETDYDNFDNTIKKVEDYLSSL